MNDQAKKEIILATLKQINTAYDGGRANALVSTRGGDVDPAAACMASGAAGVYCVEIDFPSCLKLRKQNLSTTRGDFLDHDPIPIFDRVVMNPPFTGGQVISHIEHALKFLRPDGALHSIIPGKGDAAGFRSFLTRVGATCLTDIMELPAGSFKFSGTMVTTSILTVRPRA